MLDSGLAARMITRAKGRHIDWRTSPYNTCRRRLGTNTTWYLQSHFEWDKLWYVWFIVSPCLVSHQATKERRYSRNAQSSINPLVEPVAFLL
jgi:hypothetical protein